MKKNIGAYRKQFCLATFFAVGWKLIKKRRRRGGKRRNCIHRAHFLNMSRRVNTKFKKLDTVMYK